VEYEDQISIVTPEGVALTLTLAGLGSRAIALMLDWCVRLPILIVVLVAFRASNAGAIGDIGIYITAFLLIYVYDVAFEAFWGGRTPGKRWTSLRVLHIDGRPESIGSAAVRNVIRLVDFLPAIYIAGATSIIATTNNQRLGDLSAGTIVVREPRAPKAPKPPRQTHRVAAPRPAPPTTADALPAWDVTAVTPTDLATVRMFLERRDVLAARARADLAQRLAAGIAAKIPGLDGSGPDPEQLLETVAALKQARGR
jgi:uncharacterized RDD family membrane protein YckC